METTTLNITGTRAEIMKNIRSAPLGVRFYLHVRIDAPVDSETHFRDAIAGSANLSKRAMLRFVNDCISSTLEDRGARIPFTIRTYPTLMGKPSVSYWVG